MGESAVNPLNKNWIHKKKKTEKQQQQKILFHENAK